MITKLEDLIGDFWASRTTKVKRLCYWIFCSFNKHKTC